MKRSILISAALCVAVLCGAQYSDPYKVILPAGAEYNGKVAKLVDFDTSETVDSVVVADGTALFRGTVDEPFVARIMVDGNRTPQFIVECGTIAFSKDGRKAFGSPLNDVLNEIGDSVAAAENKFAAAETDEAKEAIYDKLMAYFDRMLVENIDNPVGYIIFLDKANEMTLEELNSYLSTNPQMGEYQRVKNIIESKQKKAATAPGAKYIDFEVDGKKLSDYVGLDGKYLLVDYFASWCGPCLRQLPVLKELYSTYPDKLNVLGVAVWDEPEASLRAIEQHQLPWPCIINAGTIPTDIYGISGIPCIMLIAPDGTIVSRDLQGDELKAAVASALNN